MPFIIIFILLIILAPLILLFTYGAAIAAMAAVIGIIMLISSVIIKLFIVPYFENRTKQRLDSDHILIIPQRCHARIDTVNTYGGFSPYVIDCFYKDEKTGREFVFTSKPFKNDPSPYLSGAELAVFVNPVDYSNYYVDTSRLPDSLE